MRDGTISSGAPRAANVDTAALQQEQPNGIRLHPDFGDRGVITSQGNSAYHALQAQLNRRFARGVSAGVSYTWSKNLDSVSDVGGVNDNSQAGNRTSLPASLGGLKLDRGLSDYDRAHRLSVTFLWPIPAYPWGQSSR